MRKPPKTMLAIRLRTETAKEFWRAFLVLFWLGVVFGALFAIDKYVRG